jgi:predicted oxidoreductase
MKTRAIAHTGLETSSLAYGCWRLAGTWDQSKVTPADLQRGIKAVLTAYDAGYTLFDHADIYCSGVAETIFGQVLSENPSLREKMVIATKCGIRFRGVPYPNSPQRYDFSAEHIIRSCEESLVRLNTDVIDLYQLHRPDYLMNPEEIAEAFTKLHQKGKVRFFGVSNFTASQVDLLRSASSDIHFTSVHQVEISLLNRYAMETGLLDQCQIQRMTPLAWSPLAGGVLGDSYTPTEENLKKFPTLEDTQRTLDEIAREHQTTRSVVALAWLLKHPSGIIPIVGSVKPERIHQFTQADEVNLSREEWYKLLLAARGEPLP